MIKAIKPQNLGPWLMKSSQSNFNFRSPSSYLARSYLIATVTIYRGNKISYLKAICPFLISNATDLSLFKEMFPVSGVVYTFRISVVIFGVLRFFDGTVFFFVISSRSLSADSVPRTN